MTPPLPKRREKTFPVPVSDVALDTVSSTSRPRPVFCASTVASRPSAVSVMSFLMRGANFLVKTDAACSALNPPMETPSTVVPAGTVPRALAFNTIKISDTANTAPMIRRRRSRRAESSAAVNCPVVPLATLLPSSRHSHRRFGGFIL